MGSWLRISSSMHRAMSSRSYLLRKILFFTAQYSPSPSILHPLQPHFRPFFGHGHDQSELKVAMYARTPLRVERSQNFTWAPPPDKAAAELPCPSTVARAMGAGNWDWYSRARAIRGVPRCTLFTFPSGPVIFHVFFLSFSHLQKEDIPGCVLFFSTQPVFCRAQSSPKASMAALILAAMP